MRNPIVSINLFSVFLCPFWIYCGITLWGQPEFLLLMILAFKDATFTYTFEAKR